MLAGRVIGAMLPEACLVTEHTHKDRDIPEDRSGVEDHRLWWNTCRYPEWDESRGVPHVDMPVMDDTAAARLRDAYLQIADGRRLIVKNPSHVLYPELVRRLFPEALFVFCVRNPWPTLQSMVKKGHDNFLLKSSRVAQSDSSLLHRAAMGWADAHESFVTHRDKGWYVLDHDTLVSQPGFTIAMLSDWLGQQPGPANSGATRIPRAIEHDYLLIRRLYDDDPNQNEIAAELAAGCQQFGYPTDPSSLSGSRLKTSTLYVRKKLGSLL